MSKYSIVELEMAHKAILSSIHKNEKAKETLSQKQSIPASQTAIVSQNLNALYIASSLIAQELGLEKNYIYDYLREDLEKSKQTILSINNRIEKVLPKFQYKSPQHTLAVRRIKAHTITLDLIRERMKNDK